MGLMNINGMGDMFEKYGSNERMDLGFKMKYPSNLSPIGSPGPFGVIEMGGMFAIFKVRDVLTSYADPGWYKHPPGTIAEPVDRSMDQNMQNMYGVQMQDSPHNMNTVSWFSQEEDQKEPHGQENTNWMQSKPEDSMGGNMHGGQMGKMKNMSKENM